MGCGWGREGVGGEGREEKSVYLGVGGGGEGGGGVERSGGSWIEAPLCLIAPILCGALSCASRCAFVFPVILLFFRSIFEPIL